MKWIECNQQTNENSMDINWKLAIASSILFVCTRIVNKRIKWIHFLDSYWSEVLIECAWQNRVNIFFQSNQNRLDSNVWDKYRSETCAYVKHISIINLYHLICHEILMCTHTHGTNKFKLEHLDVNDVNRTGQMRKLKPYYRVNRTTTSTSTTATLQMRLHNLNPITLAINRIWIISRNLRLRWELGREEERMMLYHRDYTCLKRHLLIDHTVHGIFFGPFSMYSSNWSCGICF